MTQPECSWLSAMRLAAHYPCPVRFRSRPARSHERTDCNGKRSWQLADDPAASNTKEKMMKGTRLLRLTQAALLASTILAAPQLAFAEHNTAIDGNNGTLPLPTGQYVTPQAPTGAVQQFLNPGLAAYPDFVAGMAVRSQLSPDGSTLAIICAGQNTLYKSTGVVDTANSTQYIFLYNVAGANKTSPVLTQVIRQPNAHAGLV